MTISYNLDISSSNAFTFLRILLRWRGSVWKSVFNEFVAWTGMYYCVMAFYLYALSEDRQKEFEDIAKHIDEKMCLLPLTFMLGFFVTIVVDRWKQIFQNIGFVDSPAFFVGTYIRGDTQEIKTIKKNIIRYLCLTQVLVLRDISIQVRKRFPNTESLVDSGLLYLPELDLMDNVQNGFPKYWMPINWIFSLCYELRLKGCIAADVLLNGLLQEVKFYREKLQTLCNYDWVPVPLAYPQVVFLAVRIYFLLCLFSRQYRWHENAAYQNQVDRLFPLITMLQLIFFMGWLKVAEALLNPLGEDDDDFECNYIIDRNIAIALTMVDDCYDQKPPQEPENVFPSGDFIKTPLYAEQSVLHAQNPLVGSATLSHLREEKEHVRMVERRQSAVPPSVEPISNEFRRPSLMWRRFSTVSLQRHAPFRHSLSVQENRIRPVEELDAQTIAGWTEKEVGKIETMEKGHQHKHGQLQRTLSSTPTMQQHHLDPVKEDESGETSSDEKWEDGDEKSNSKR